MNTLSKLTEAMELMKRAEDLVNEAREENESLANYYGYSLEIIAQELHRFGHNRKCYQGNTSLDEIIEQEGEDWDNGGNIIEEDNEPVYVAPKTYIYPAMPSNYTEDQLIEAAQKVFDDSDRSKLQAVKFVKDTAGWGLKEAKDFCDEKLFN